jgi:hypothetical protein
MSLRLLFLPDGLLSVTSSQLFSSFFLFPLKVITLSEDNRVLDEENKRLLGLLEKERQRRSERKKSASTSTKVKLIYTLQV